MTTKDNTAALLPCPFCGKADNLIRRHLEGTTIHPTYCIECDYCGARNGWTDKGDEADDWNTRAQPRQTAEQQGGAIDFDHIAGMLESYAASLRAYAGADLERWHYIPEIEEQAQAVRALAPQPSQQPAQEDDAGDRALRAEWMACETRRPWVVNSLRHRAEEMRAAEKRCRNAYRKDFMGKPAAYVADAFADAAAAFEVRLAAMSAAQGDAAQGGEVEVKCPGCGERGEPNGKDGEYRCGSGLSGGCTR